MKKNKTPFHSSLSPQNCLVDEEFDTLIYFSFAKIYQPRWRESSFIFIRFVEYKIWLITFFCPLVQDLAPLQLMDLDRRVRREHSRLSQEMEHFHCKLKNLSNLLCRKKKIKNYWNKWVMIYIYSNTPSLKFGCRSLYITASCCCHLSLFSNMYYLNLFLTFWAFSVSVFSFILVLLSFFVLCNSNVWI